jgi:hypothetical protein
LLLLLLLSACTVVIAVIAAKACRSSRLAIIPGSDRRVNKTMRANPAVTWHLKVLQCVVVPAHVH